MAIRHNKPSKSINSPSLKTHAIVAGLGVDVVELQRARALWMANRFEESLQLFEKAVQKYPQNLVALTDASRALGARFEIAKAEKMLDRLVKLASNNAQLLHLAGQSYRMIYRAEKAIHCFERALAITRQIPDAQLELAVLYERRHRVEEAYSLIEDCLRTAPDYLEAALFKGRLLRRMKELSAQALFRTLALNEQAHPLVRAQAWTEIAQKADQDGDYDGAMQAILKCKDLLRQDEAPVLKESEVLQRHLRNLIQSLTRKHFEKWSQEGRAFPQCKLAVLAGFPRSGTTLLEQVLDSHPRLISSDEREAFGRDVFPAMWRSATNPLPTAETLDSVPAGTLASQRARYLNYMEAALNEPIGERVHLDKNPTMTLLLPGLLRLFPETRLLIALRDPRDVVISCFMQYLPLNPNSVCFLTLERAARRYAHDLGAWLELREKICAPWLQVKYEDTIANLEREARAVLEFLELPWTPEVLEYRDRLKTKAVSSPTYEAVSKPLYTSAIGRWKNYTEYLAPCLEILKPCIKAFGYEE
jgi:tetratricopeptide (TPR) repeat protein